MFGKKLLVLLCCCSVTAIAANKKIDSGESDLVIEKAPQVTDTKVSSNKDTTTSKKEQQGSNHINSKGGLFFALESTLLNNKDILEAQRGLLALHEKYVQASSAFKPTITANADYTAGPHSRWETIPGSSRSADSHDTMHSDKTCGVTVSQNLFNGMSDTALLKETDLNIRAKWSEYEATKQKIMQDVSIIYFKIIAIKQDVSQLKVLLASRKNSIEVATEKYSAGAEKYLGVSEASAGYAETDGRLAKAEADHYSLCAQFENLTGTPAPANLDTPAKLIDTNMTVTQALDIALKNNPQIIAAADALAAAKEAIKKPNIELTPSVNASYSYDHTLGNRSSYRSSTTETASTSGTYSEREHNRDSTFKVGVKIPLYDGGVGRSQRREAQELATKAAIDKEKIINDTKASIISVWANMESARKELICAEQGVAARELALHDTEEEYNAGLKIMFDVLDAQQKLFLDRVTKIRAEEAYFVSQCQAIALLGRMNAKYLKIHDSDFNYKAHLAKTKLTL